MAQRDAQRSDYVLEMAVEEALDTILRTVPPEARLEVLRELRTQIERCLAHAPTTTDAVASLVVRAEMAQCLSRYIPQG